MRAGEVKWITHRKAEIKVHFLKRVFKRTMLFVFVHSRWFYITCLKGIFRSKAETTVQTKILLEKGRSFAASLIGREKLMGPRNIHFFIHIMVFNLIGWLLKTQCARKCRICYSLSNKNRALPEGSQSFFKVSLRWFKITNVLLWNVWYPDCKIIDNIITLNLQKIIIEKKSYST